MKFTTLAAHKYCSLTVMSFPIVFLVGLTLAGIVPAWFTLGYYSLSFLSIAYYRFIRLPLLRKEAVFEAMFGFITCPHGHYLPDDPCGTCADKWVEKNLPNLAGASTEVPVKNSSGETLH